MSEFREVAQRLMPKVIQDPAVETAWLSCLVHMEDIAARQIRTNISAFTPAHEREAILEHAADEDRHAQIICTMKPLSELPDQRYKDLEKQICQIAEHFVVGYFGNPLLITASNKHAAYAHGAVTIEQFPFQVYTAYLKATSLSAVKEKLPDVIRDEQAHIQLGKRLLTQLPEDQRLSIEKLMEIEEDMCARMLSRIDAVLAEFYAGSAGHESANSFEVAVSRSYPTTVAWVYTLGYAEALAAHHMEKIYSLRGITPPAIMPEHMADELRHGKMLQRTIVIDRRRLSRDPRYSAMEQGTIRAMKRYQMRLFSSIMKRVSNPDLIYLFGSLALETRVFRHYKTLSAETNHSGIGHVIGTILEDEVEHTRQVSGELRALDYDKDEYREIALLEAQYWNEATDKALELMNEYLTPGAFTTLATTLPTTPAQELNA